MYTLHTAEQNVLKQTKRAKHRSSELICSGITEIQEHFIDFNGCQSPTVLTANHGYFQLPYQTCLLIYIFLTLKPPNVHLVLYYFTSDPTLPLSCKCYMGIAVDVIVGHVHPIKLQV